MAAPLASTRTRNPMASLAYPNRPSSRVLCSRRHERLRHAAACAIGGTGVDRVRGARGSAPLPLARRLGGHPRLRHLAGLPPPRAEAPAAGARGDRHDRLARAAGAHPAHPRAGPARVRGSAHAARVPPDTRPLRRRVSVGAPAGASRGRVRGGAGRAVPRGPVDAAAVAGRAPGRRDERGRRCRGKRRTRDARSAAHRADPLLLSAVRTRPREAGAPCRAPIRRRADGDDLRADGRHRPRGALRHAPHRDRAGHARGARALAGRRRRAGAPGRAHRRARAHARRSTPGLGAGRGVARLPGSVARRRATGRLVPRRREQRRQPHPLVAAQRRRADPVPPRDLRRGGRAHHVRHARPLHRPRRARSRAGALARVVPRDPCPLRMLTDDSADTTFSRMSRRYLATALLLLAVAAAGCLGPYRTAVVDPKAPGGLAPTIEDPDVGLVGVSRGFDIRQYSVMAVARFDVNKDDVKDDEDRNLAAVMPDFFQSEIVRRLRAAGIFERVINLTERDYAPGQERTLRIEGTITRLAPGNRAMRYLIGFGAGAAKAQAETRFVDVQTGQVVVVTADRREASFGIFGGDSEEHLQESFSDMARDLAKYLVRLRGQGPARTTAAAPGAPGGAAITAAQALAGTWR